MDDLGGTVPRDDIPDADAVAPVMLRNRFRQRQAVRIGIGRQFHGGDCLSHSIRRPQRTDAGREVQAILQLQPQLAQFRQLDRAVNRSPGSAARGSVVLIQTIHAGSRSDERESPSYLSSGRDHCTVDEDTILLYTSTLLRPALLYTRQTSATRR